MRKSFAFAFIALVSSIACQAHAQSAPSATTISDAATLATDAQTYASDLKAGASNTTLATDAAKVNADTGKVASDSGIAATTVTVGKHVLNLNIGGAGAANIAFPAKTGGVSVAAGAGGGVLVDLGFGQQTDGSDHYHVAAALMLNSLSYTTAATESTPASTTSVGAVTIALTPAYQPSATAPEFGLGPALACPFTGSKRSCILGLSFTTGFSFVAHQFTS